MLPSRTDLINRGRKMFPEHVRIEPPRDEEEVRQRKETLGQRYEDILGEMPEKCDLRSEE